jgi:hypothetical protein
MKEIRDSKSRVFWDVLSCSLVGVYYNEITRRYIPEDSEVHTHRSENLKSHTQYEIRLEENVTAVL